MSSPEFVAPQDLPDLLRDSRRIAAYDLNCHQLGSIISFDSATGKAVVQLATLRQQGDIQVPYPLLSDCPVFVLFGGGANLTMPIAAGDPCLVLFSDRDIDNWFVSGGVSPANTQRCHDLSDGLVLVGFRPLASPLSPSPSTTDAELRNGGAKVGVGPEGKIALSNGTGSLLTALTDLVTALTGWIDTRGDTPNPATVTALNAAKTKITNILK